MNGSENSSGGGGVSVIVRGRRVSRWLIVTVAVLIALVGPARQVDAADSDPEAVGSGATAPVRQAWSALRYLPRDAYFVAGLRPRDLLKATELDDVDRLLASLIEYSLGRRVDVVVSDVEQLAVVGTYGGARISDYNALAVIELASPDAASRLMEALFGGEFDEQSDERNSLSAIVAVRELAGVLLGDRTVLLGQPAVLQNWDFPHRSSALPAGADLWPVQSSTPETTHAFAVFDVERLRRFAPRYDDWMLNENPWLAAASPILRQTRRLEVVASGLDGLRLTTTILTDQETLADVEGTLRAGATILRNVLSETPEKLPVWSRDVASPTLSLFREVLRMPTVESDVESGKVQLTVAATDGQLRSIGAVLAPLAETFEVSSRRALRSRNLQRIALAAINYYEVHNHLPLPVAADGDSGMPHSWRVTLLPFLGEEALFKRYRQNEPWNSPANQKVLRQMPDVYRHVDDSPTSYRSAYYGLVGPETAFGDGREPVRLRDIRDGTSNTILVVESQQGVPWTMPSDIEVLPDRPLPSFGGFDPTGAFVARVDTTVSFLPVAVPEASRRAFATRAGGERISLP